MNFKNESITIKFYVEKDHCECCRRKFDAAQIIDTRLSDLSLKDIGDYCNWNYLDETELNEAVNEIIYECIIYNGVGSSYDRIRLVDGEFEKVLMYIKTNLLG